MPVLFLPRCRAGRWLSCLVSAALALVAAPAWSAPAVPGFARFHAAGEKPQAGGELLLGELNCTSCHQAEKAIQAVLLPKQAPILDTLGTRVRPEYVREFLDKPHQVKPGTTMPDPFAGWDEAEKKAAVEALTHFLATSGVPSDQRIALGAIAQGESLFHRVGCAACHDPQRGSGAKLVTSVPLGNLSAKYTLPGLAMFLQDPHKVRPSGRMPSLNLLGDEARNLAAYLLRDLKDLQLPANLKFALYNGSWDKLPDFDKLKPAIEGETSGFDFTFVASKDNFAVRFMGTLQIPRDGEYRFHIGSDDGSRLSIDERVVIDHDGIHGTTYKDGRVRLTAGKHALIIDFFEQAGGEELFAQIEGNGLTLQPIENLLVVEKRPETAEKPPFVLNPELAAKGKTLFASIGCASCHQRTDGGAAIASTVKAPAFASLKNSGGCLAPTPKKGVPNYELNDVQRAALVAGIAAVQKPAVERSPAGKIARTLETFNCYACHQRDKLGGIEQTRNAFFQTTQPEMGDEGRVPPPLDGVGGKLKPLYLEQLLHQGLKERPYMHTRMPKFGVTEVVALGETFANLDQRLGVAKVDHSYAPREMKQAGRLLVGSRGFSCIKCHTWGEHEATGIQSIDMQRMSARLNQDWFEAYLKNPQTFRSGTRMPAAWPDGQVLLPKVLDGKVHTQVRSLWDYLADGRRASIPQGLGRDPIELVAETEAIIYRNFIEGGGPRAIGVGYPEKVNLAFDANNLRLAMIWHGSFIDASKHWVDRGAGFQPPLGDNVLPLTQGVPLAQLANDSTPWPAQPAKALGYQFRGYRLDSLRRPTFLYSYGDVQIADEPLPVVEGDIVKLRRTLTIKSAKPIEHLYFRAAADAAIQAGTGDVYTIDSRWKMKLTHSAAKPQLRQIGGKTELLLPLTFTNGETKIVQEYQW